MLTVQDKDLGKIPYGEFIKISPTRVPRLIGKRGSMIQTIEQATQTRVIIGQNGIVVVTGRDPEGLSLAAKAIRLVEEESHTTNLTQRVKTLLNVQDPEDQEQSEAVETSSSSASGGEIQEPESTQQATSSQPQPEPPQASAESSQTTSNSVKTSSSTKEKHKIENSEKSSNSNSNDDQKEKKQE
jgi:exosome complex component RRP4